MNFKRCILLMLSIISLCLKLAAAPQSSLPSTEEPIVTTRHQITLGGRVLRYTARAGRLPIIENETGEVHGRMFFTAYTLDATPASTTRPVTFLWNGGPGSSSSLVHLLGFGPRRLQPDGTAVDNPGTWLDGSDLVFVDPIGTGYSRPTKAAYGAEFYQTRGDAESVAEFIRVYRNRYQAWEAPLFLAGESYGVIRAAGVADVLERRGINVNGVILIGLALPLGQLTSEQRTALQLPTWTAAAWVNRKLAPELQSDLQTTLRQAEAWAQGDYASALARRDQLSDRERQRVLAELARFTGIDAKQLDAKTLSIGMEQFSQQLLADRNQVVGRYDSRLVGPRDPQEKQYDPTKDPSLKSIINDTGVVRYFRNELQYQSDLQYQGPFGGGYPSPDKPRGDWMSVRWKFGDESAVASGNLAALGDAPLRRALAANPKMQVLSVCGYYDLVCSYHANVYVTKHLEESIAGKVSARGYGGGHAVYTDQHAQMELKRDIIKFMENARPPAPQLPSGKRPRN
jgi:carboxypeptidase C (cathepsin A)